MVGFGRPEPDSGGTQSLATTRQCGVNHQYYGILTAAHNASPNRRRENLPDVIEQKQDVELLQVVGSREGKEMTRKVKQL